MYEVRDYITLNTFNIKSKEYINFLRKNKTR